MELDPANIDYRISFAKVLYEVETSNAAIGYLYSVLENFPDNSKIYSAIGTYYYRSGQIKKYEDIKEKILSLPTKDVSLYEFLIESSRLDDNVDKMIEYSESLILISPGNLKERLNLASTYIGLQKYKKAKKHLDAISSRYDSYPKLQLLYAKLYFLIDKVDKATMLAEREIKENPTVEDGYNLLGDIYIKEKDLIKARKFYLKAMKINPKNIAANMGVAYIAFHRDRYDMALDQYQKVIEIDPSRSDVYRLLGDVYRKLGQSQLAIRNYKQFLEISPNSQYKNSIKTYIRTLE